MRILLIFCNVAALWLLLGLPIIGCRPQAEPVESAIQSMLEALQHNELGVQLLEEGRYDEAIVEFNRAIELAPKLAMAYTNRGSAYINKGELDKAIADCDKAIDLDPKLAEAYSNRAYAYWE